MFEEGRVEEAKGLLESVLPGWILNPRIHQLISFAWHKLGQEEAAQYELAVAVALLNGILSTGDGSKAQPYLVLYPADEYDLLAYLGTAINAVTAQHALPVLHILALHHGIDIQAHGAVAGAGLAVGATARVGYQAES